MTTLAAIGGCFSSASDGASSKLWAVRPGGQDKMTCEPAPLSTHSDIYLHGASFKLWAVRPSGQDKMTCEHAPLSTHSDIYLHGASFKLWAVRPGGQDNLTCEPAPLSTHSVIYLHGASFKLWAVRPSGQDKMTCEHAPLSTHSDIYLHVYIQNIVGVTISILAPTVTHVFKGQDLYSAAVNIGRTELHEFVLDQWRLADLRDMGVGCLPSNLASQIKVTLAGKYSLQVESVVDIAHPSYGQLLKLRQVSTENVDMTETKAQSWEPKSGRVLQLSLCDGLQEIKGMEYRPISKLNTPLLPGCKVLVIGPLDCRRGVLLLQEHNLQLLGGEVDSLLVPNALENILARKLNLEENEHPYIVGSTSSSEPSLSRETVAVPTPISQGNRPVAQVAPLNHNAEEDELILGAELDAIEQQLQMEEDNLHDFDQDIELDNYLSRFERNVPTHVKNLCGRQSIVSASTNTQKHKMVTTSQMGQTHNSNRQFEVCSSDYTRQNLMSTTSQKGQSSILNSMNKNQKGAIKNVNPSKSECFNTSNSKISNFQTQFLDDLDDFDFEEPSETNKTSHQNSTSLQDKTFRSNLLEEDDDLLLDISTQDLDVSFQSMPAGSKVLRSYPTSGSSKKTSSDQKSLRQDSVNPLKTETQRNKKQQINQSKITSFWNKLKEPPGKSKPTNNLSSGIFVTQSNSVKRSPSSPLKETCDTPKKCGDASKTLPKSVFIKTSSFVSESVNKRLCTSSVPTWNSCRDLQNHTKQEVQSGSVKESNFKQGATSGQDEAALNQKDLCIEDSSRDDFPFLVQPPLVAKEPFVRLSDVLHSTSSLVGTFTVKAFIVTLLSHLKFKKEGWHLLCKIDDSTAMLDVVISSDVLARLIGFSPAEVRTMRVEMAVNPLVKERMRKALEATQKKLIELNCLMDVTFSLDKETPVVSVIHEHTQEHNEELANRVQLFKKSKEMVE
uniref:RecQ-mediated genome instability protein 1 n=1 Tax=Timema cristinae TaxID=61476 RepID=A0A7R9CIH2_TIMCR|nr:unnamed protein product [Timema cristinae]